MPVLTADTEKQLEAEKTQPASDVDVYVNEFEVDGETITESSTATYDLDVGRSGAVALSHNIEDADIEVRYDGLIDSDNEVHVEIENVNAGDVTLAAGDVIKVIVYDY